ncbi:hypothetical protein CFBP4996_07380 [Agrobacterium leguminum]|nr:MULTISPECIES: hypothetical protein [Agrobacterium]WFS67096.1 hypothetical protein CFBP4996_07380 [Agrobacterium leguminum]
MREHWDRWGWIIPFIIISIVMLRITMGRAAFCGAETEHCLREWLSAVGGWAAVGAAVPSILYLAKQVKDAENQYKISKSMEVRRLRALANHIIDHSTKVEKLTKDHIEKTKQHKLNGTSYTYKTVISEVDVVHRFIQSSHFVNFEKDVFVPQRSATFIKAQFDFILDMWGALKPDAKLDQDALGVAMTVMEVALEYASSIKEQAAIYLKDTARFDMSLLTDEAQKLNHDRNASST